MLQKIVKWSIYLLVFLLPIFWLPWSFKAFEFNKSYLLLFLVSVGVLAWLGRMVFEDKKVSFKRTPLDIFVLLFLLVSILTAVFSVDKYSSFFGFYGRSWPSLIGIIALGLFYFLVTNNVNVKTEGKNSKSETLNSKQIQNPKSKIQNQNISVNSLVKTFLWSGVVVMAVAYLSVFGVWQEISKVIGLPSVMSSGTFNPVGGSAEQAAMFLTVIFILLLSYLALREAGGRSVFLYLYLFLIFIFLSLVDFWPSWFVLAVSLFGFLAFSFWKRIFKEDVAKLSLSIIFLLASLIFLISNPLKGVLNQIPGTGTLPKEVLPSQSASWSIGFEGLKESPVFGAGNGNFNYLFAKFKPQSFLETPFWQIRFDRASNHIAEIIGTGGALGILSFLALIGMFWIITIIILNSKLQITNSKQNKNSNDQNSKLGVPVFLTFLGLMAAQFVFYQNTTLAFSFWLFMGLGAVSWQKPLKEKTFKFADFPEAGLILSVVFWILLVGTVFLYFFGAKNYLADVYYRNYLRAPRENLASLEKAVRTNGNNPAYHMALGRAYSERVKEETGKEQPDNQMIVNLVALSLREGRRAQEISPNRIAALETLAIIYRDIQGLAQGALDWSVRMFKQALVLEPKNPVLLTELGKLQLGSGKKEEAKSLFKEAINWKNNYIPAHIQLATIEETEGEIEKAIKRLEGVVSQNPFSVEAHFQLGRLYYNNKEYDKAIGQFQSALAIFPNHSNSHYSLGLVYERRGQISRALDEFEKVLELNPDNEDVKAKIRSLRYAPPAEEKEEGE